MRIRDYVSSKLNEVEHTKYWQPWQSSNYVIAGGEICDNIRWCELRPVKHARGVCPI
ncbi:MAG: hypothetical protein PV347_01290 [Rickettsiaceae bacterium]|nr:hypothetical protein [Rickettsiaceae bacterium]MDD9337008.1 hypothetical protein [Rickettsiaceae bacterium]